MNEVNGFVQACIDERVLVLKIRHFSCRKKEIFSKSMYIQNSRGMLADQAGENTPPENNKDVV